MALSILWYPGYRPRGQKEVIITLTGRNEMGSEKSRHTSRRRQTRLVGDWSSDVCSSDLLVALDLGLNFELRVADRFADVFGLLGCDALGDGDLLAHRAGQGLFDLAVVERLDRNASFDQFVLQNVDYALQLRVV